MYLLLLKRADQVEQFYRPSSGLPLTVFWTPLAPTNEQVREHGDKWVEWVRRQVSQKYAPHAPVACREMMRVLTVVAIMPLRLNIPCEGAVEHPLEEIINISMHAQRYCRVTNSLNTSDLAEPATMFMVVSVSSLFLSRQVATASQLRSARPIGRDTVQGTNACRHLNRLVRTFGPPVNSVERSRP